MLYRACGAVHDGRIETAPQYNQRFEAKPPIKATAGGGSEAKRRRHSR